MNIAAEAIRKKSLELLKPAKQLAGVYQNGTGCVNQVKLQFETLSRCIKAKENPQESFIWPSRTSFDGNEAETGQKIEIIKPNWVHNCENVEGFLPLALGYTVFRTK